MKKKIIVRLILFAFVLFAPAANATPTAQEYRNSAFDVKTLRTVLVMPVKVPASLPYAGFAKNIKYKWGELIHMKRGEGGYAVLTPDQLLQKHYTAKSVSPKQWENDLQRVSYVTSLAPGYADGVLTMTVISCDYISYSVPASYVSDEEYEEVKDWDENGRITARKELVSKRTLQAKRTYYFSEASCRVELWGMKDGNQTLVYSCIANDARDSRFTAVAVPPPDKITAELMEYVMKRVPVR